MLLISLQCCDQFSDVYAVKQSVLQSLMNSCSVICSILVILRRFRLRLRLQGRMVDSVSTALVAEIRASSLPDCVCCSMFTANRIC